jgi:geranylgeranyl diphosphate synthase type II
MSKTFDLESWMAARRAEIENTLKTRLPPPEEDPGRLVEAMRYSVLTPGKRFRPLLAMGAAEAVGASSSEPIRLAAAAIELVHTYSLVHDDLPAMDDDDTRRGQPSNHKVFGEATAILAGDALLTLAFEWLSEAGVLARTAQEEGRWARSSRAVGFLHAARALARAAGMAGMVRGQSRDLAGKRTEKTSKKSAVGPNSLQELETLHREKTGALFRAALEVGALAAGAPATDLAALRDFGDFYGVAFQHADDLADGEHKELAAQTRPRVRELAEKAIGTLQGLGSGAEPLRAMARALGHK